MKINRILTWFFLLPTLVYAEADPIKPIPPVSSKFESKSTASLENINGRVESGFENFFVAAKWFGLVLGIVTVLISLKNIADISQGKKSGSVGMNLVGIMVGGAMAAASTILFMAGGATERIATGKEL